MLPKTNTWYSNNPSSHARLTEQKIKQENKDKTYVIAQSKSRTKKRKHLTRGLYRGVKIEIQNRNPKWPSKVHHATRSEVSFSLLHPGNKQKTTRGFSWTGVRTRVLPTFPRPSFFYSRAIEEILCLKQRRSQKKDANVRKCAVRWRSTINSQNTAKK